MTPDPLHDILGRPELNRFLQRLRRRLESGRSLTGTLTLSPCKPEERDALNRLLRRTPTLGLSITVPLEILEQNLRRAGLCENLPEAVERLTGPVIDKLFERFREARSWDELFAGARHSLGEKRELVLWLDQLQARGLLRRHGIESASRLLDQSLKILAALPARGIPLAGLAASVLGDAHALDSGRALSPILLRAISLLGGIERRDDSGSRRDVWASAGVLLDELSAPVAVLNLRASGNDSTSRSLNLHAETAEPCFLTIRQLVRSPPSFAPSATGAIAYIFENKNILAAAANRLSKDCPPLVATDGQPKTALHLLLKLLTSAGIRLRYHGDFDWPGIRIANSIHTRYGAETWKMTAADYLASATGNLALSGLPVDALWDEKLRETMEGKGIALHEEQVLDALLPELS